jgi:hypothetical protein
MVYSFAIVQRMDSAPPTYTSEITQPLWSLPLIDTRTNRGNLSQGLSNALTTHFFLATKDAILSLVVPISNNQPPRLIKMTELDRPRGATSVIGFGKAFLQYPDKTVSRMSFAWGTREVGSIEPWPPGSSIRAISYDYPTTCDGARLPKFDEETGRIVQDSWDGVWVIDSTLCRQ